MVKVLEKFETDALTNEFMSLFLLEEDPKTYQEAMRSIDATFWKEAIKSEIDSLESNKTWELTDLLKGCRPISSRWIFKKKFRTDSSIDRYKARLVIREALTSRRELISLIHIPLVTKIATIRTLIALAAIHDLVVHQMDVKTMFF